MLPRLASALPALALALTAAAPEALAQEDSGRQAFVNATILPMAGEPIEDGVILVRYGRITSLGPEWAGEIPADAERIDLGGRFVMPGLVNAHGHVGGVRGLETSPDYHSEEDVAEQLARYARYGVTTVFSLGGERAAALREAAASGRDDRDRARVFAAGPVVEGTTPAEVKRRVELVESMGADLVKIRVDDNFDTTPKMPPPTYAAVIEQAHALGLPVAAHIYELEDAKGLVEAGVDLIAHSVRDQPVDAELVALLRDRNVCVCPTLTRELSVFAYGGVPDFFEDPFFQQETDPEVVAALRDPERQRRVRESELADRIREALEIAKANLKTLSDAGVGIAFGTDSGPPGRFQGYFEHLELAMMVDAGLTPAQVLEAATAGAARCSGQAGRVGTLEPGAWADLLVLEADPRQDVANLRRIHSVWVGGRRVPARP
jgi:imidazolonepropionase-like amidohydrolase